MRRRSGYGWFELIIGILLVVLGICTYANPGRMMTWLVVIYGIVAIITGIADIVFYVRASRFTGFGPMVSLLSGILSIMAGAMLLVYPAAGRLVLVMLIPIWFIAHCISRLSSLGLIRSVAGKVYYWICLIINILGIVLGIMMIIYPYISFLTAGVIIGTYLVLFGIDSIVVGASKIGERY